LRKLRVKSGKSRKRSKTKKENQMSSRLKLGLILAILVAAAIFAAFWVTTMILPPSFPVRRGPTGGFVPGDFEYFYFAYTIISTINIALLVILLITFVNIYNKTRSPFTIGLIIFAAAFLMKDIASSPFVTGLFGFIAFGLGPFVFLPGIFEFAALSVLLYLSVRY
jgi:hypothetical protein